MKFFIDTANLEQIKEAQALGVLDGVTTNPSLMAKEGISGAENILQHYLDICEAVDGDVSAEVISTDFEGMIREGEALADLHSQIVVKLPMIKDGIKAARLIAKGYGESELKNHCKNGVECSDEEHLENRRVELKLLKVKPVRRKRG